MADGEISNAVTFQPFLDKYAASSPSPHPTTNALPLDLIFDAHSVRK